MVGVIRKVPGAMWDVFRLPLFELFSYHLDQPSRNVGLLYENGNALYKNGKAGRVREYDCGKEQDGVMLESLADVTQ